jgi:PEP-CTERM motif
MKVLAKSFALAALCCLSAAAQATTFNLNLTGALASARTGSLDIGATHYDFWSLDLNGLNAGNAITLNGGDVINATVTLDGPHTMPASVDGSFFVFYLDGASFPTTDTQTSTATTLLLGGAPVLNQTGIFGSSAQIAGGFYLAPPDNLAFTFDKVMLSITIDQLALPAVVDRASVLTQLNSPAAVPEPGTGALIVAGVAMLGGLARRRQQRL